MNTEVTIMMNMPPLRRRATRGFTLIELMIAVAIVGLLAAIALPAYNSSVRKARRTDAKNALLDLAQREERFYSTTNTYSVTATPDLGYNSGSTVTQAAPMPVLSGSKAYYNMSVQLVTGQAATASTQGTAAGWSAQAAPVGTQSGDPCGTFKLDSTGKQDLTNNTAAVSDCW